MIQKIVLNNRSNSVIQNYLYYFVICLHCVEWTILATLDRSYNFELYPLLYDDFE